jgi:GH25 family lysozyme M1 (1,4-beta-N-acetylmuramidase)
MTRAFGIDVSKWDASIPPSPDVDFIIQRASYGGWWASHRDEKFIQFLPSVMSVPIRGAYHYFSSKRSWKEQADKFLSVVSGLDYHFYVCDVETLYNDMNKTFIASAMEWCKYVHEKTGKKVVLYSNYYVYRDYIHAYDGVRASQYDFWFAWYPDTIPVNTRDNFQPPLPPGRKSWSLWQFSPGESNDFGTPLGIGRRGVDVNVFNGTVADMRLWLGMDDAPEVPPEVEEPPVEDEVPPVIIPPSLPVAARVIATSGVNLRTEPRVSSTNKIGAFPQGTDIVITKVVRQTDGAVWAEVSGGWICAILTSGQPLTTEKFFPADWFSPLPVLQTKYYRLLHDVENPKWDYESRLIMFQKWGTYVGKKATGYPETHRLSGGKSNVTLSPAWVRFFDAINTAKASEFTRRPDSGWFNRGTWPTVEQLSFGGNTVEAIKEVGDRVYVKTYFNTDAPPSLSGNFYDPAVIHYFSVVTRSGSVISSPVGHIRTFLIARNREEALWIPRNQLVAVPDLKIYMPSGG